MDVYAKPYFTINIFKTIYVKRQKKLVASGFDVYSKQEKNLCCDFFNSNRKLT